MITRYSSIIFLPLWFISISATLSAETTQPMDYPPAGSYVVAVSSNTFHQPEWKKVVDILRKKHDGAVVVYAGSVRNALPVLCKTMPRYTCFVARPQEANQDFVVDVHRLTRTLDEDPYTDTIWGILTGYDAYDAQRIARRSEPLIIRRGLCGTSGIGLGPFETGLQFDEGHAGGYRIKGPDGSVIFTNSPADSTRDLVKALNSFKPDVVYTSGHGTERGWQIGYNYNDGFVQCRNGALYGKDTQGKEYPINSPNVKVYMPVGNCLVGNIPKRDCYALALMHSGGVHQMFGYTAVTFFGYMGWGIDSYFSGMRDRYTFAQAFYCNNQVLVNKLVTQFPAFAQLDLPSFDHKAVMGFAASNSVPQEAFKMLWDRDAVAFYGDPAWEVRCLPKQLDWSWSLEKADTRYDMTVRTHRKGTWPNRPVVILLENRVCDPVIITSTVPGCAVADNFVMLPLEGTFGADEKHRIAFRGNQQYESSDAALSRAVPVQGSLSQMVHTMNAVVKTVPLQYQADVSNALLHAGENARELIRALEEAREEELLYVSFLIANMPGRDLKKLTAVFILENVRSALETRTEFPWGTDIPEELFMQYVLPYTQVTECRVNWRTVLREQCTSLVSNCLTAAEAAETLNRTIWKNMNVRYSARPEQTDQDPLQTIKNGTASCTGLSILLADACRAVGVPARLAGIARWPMKPGNHTWVEIWDGDWYFTGAAEPDELNKAWFTGDAAHAVETNELHAIYAVSFVRTGTRFPCAWAPDVSYVHGENITGRYTSEKKASGQCPVRVRCYDKPGGKRIKATVTVIYNGIKTAEGTTRDESNDLNDILEFSLEPGKKYTLAVSAEDGVFSECTLPVTNITPEELVFYHAEPE